VDDKEISPFRPETFAPILRQAATQLDTRGSYYPDQIRDITDRTTPTASENLIVTDTWAIYARQRSSNVLLGDLDRLKTAVNDTEELPRSSTRLVTEPSTEPPHSTGGLGIGGSGSQGAVRDQTAAEDSEGSEDFFFPKPFNDEQIAIIKRLEKSDGMVVQGPPGTGKTHTIANIICHCLATGKRILVTSKAGEPLVEVRNHIPEGIRDLVISLLTTEREGLKQLEQAVRILSNTATRVDTEQVNREIVAGQRRVAELREKIEKIDRELLNWAEKHLTRISLHPQKHGEELTPAELAEHLVNEREKHTWLGDELDLDLKHDPRFTEEDVAAARSARRILGADLVYFSSVLPSMADLPDSTTIRGLHHDLVGAANLDQRIAGEGLPALSMTTRDAAIRAEALLTAIEQVIQFFDDTTDKRWLTKLFEVWRREGLDSGNTRLFNELIPIMSAIADRRPEMLRDAVRVPRQAVGHPKVVEAVERAICGKRPFSPISFGNSEAKALVEQIEIQGQRPKSSEDWQKVSAYLAWRGEITQFSGKWTAIREEFDLPSLEDDGDRTGRWIADALSLLNKASHIVQDYGPRMSQEVKELFPHGVDARTVGESKASAAALAEVINLNLSKIRLAGSRTIRANLINQLAVCSGAAVDQMKKFVEHDLGNPAINAQQAGDRWETHCRELIRIHNLKPQLAEVTRVANLIQESGGLNWAEQIRTQPTDNADDSLLPGRWS
jgi:hypothetical protein